MAIFSTTDFSYHGHPDALKCPEGMSRKSLALYYYSNGRPSSEINAGLEEHTTVFQSRKGVKKDKDAMRRSYSAKAFIKDILPPIITRAIKK
jgi:hypothetical protein